MSNLHEIQTPADYFLERCNKCGKRSGICISRSEKHYKDSYVNQTEGELANGDSLMTNTIIRSFIPKDERKPEFTVGCHNCLPSSTGLIIICDDEFKAVTEWNKKNVIDPPS